ncbi:MAG: hypothetical protein FH761_04055 [Firmicutes bacterium]|nr:hypothetical protein [Bacillota bacterium]
MKAKNWFLKISYRGLINVLVNYFFIMLFINALDLEVDFNLILIIICVSILSISFWRVVFRKPLILIIIFVIALIVLAYMNFYQYELYLELLEKFDDFVTWSYRFIAGLTFLHKLFFNILLSVAIFILSLFTSALTYKQKGVYILLFLGTLIFVVRWFQFSDIAIVYGIFYIGFVLMLLAFNIYISKEKHWEEDGKIIKTNIIRNWIIYSTIVCILIVFIAAAIPKNFSPITWRWLDDKLQGRFDHFANWRNSRKTSFSYGNKMKFDLTLTDFQGEYKRLGGPVNQKDILIMTVKSDEPLYLKGRVKDFYTGSYWKSSDSSYKQELKGIANSSYDKNILGKEIRYTITHKNIVTSSLFNAYIPKTFNLASSYYYLTKENEAFTDQLVLKDKSYTVTSVKPYIYPKSLDYSMYIPKKDFEKYLQLPTSIPSSVDDIAYKLTRGLTNDYVKAVAIKTYLRNNFEYTLQPPETPYNKDFVDYFLNDLKRGYCTYFASSMVVLARSAGIPARYVEGFKASNENVNEDGQYLVYSSNAHAWAEVYIEGNGWMIFEATPRYSNVSYEEKEIANEEEAIDGEIDTDLDAIDRNLQDMMEPAMEEELLIEGELLQQEEESKGIILFKIIMYMIITVLALVLLKTLINIFKIKKLFRRVNNKEDRDKILDYYKYIVNLLDKVDKGKNEYETTIEYSSRLKLDVWEVDYKFNEVTDIFNKARYSEEEILKNEVNQVIGYYYKTENKIKNNLGRIKFFLYKYFLMEIYK